MNTISADNHAKNLKDKHEKLNKKVDKLEDGKVYDEREMNALKQQKLKVKDELEQTKEHLEKEE